MDSPEYAIDVDVATRFLDERSAPEDDRFVFAYTIQIRNRGSVPAQLLARHWIITDANGDVQEVRGPGVIGETPVLAPGAAFEYTSYCPLTTAVGTMQGSYTMTTPGGDSFDALIAPFTLAMPHALN